MDYTGNRGAAINEERKERKEEKDIKEVRRTKKKRTEKKLYLFFSRFWGLF